jgi:hypothetical protein
MGIKIKRPGKPKMPKIKMPNIPAMINKLASKLFSKLFGKKIADAKRKAGYKASLIQYKIVNLVIVGIMAFLAYNIFLAMIL